MGQEGQALCSHPSLQYWHGPEENEVITKVIAIVSEEESVKNARDKAVKLSWSMYRRTSTLPALQCTGVATMSHLIHLNTSRTSTRSQHVFHRAVHSHGTAGFSGCS